MVCDDHVRFLTSTALRSIIRDVRVVYNIRVLLLSCFLSFLLAQFSSALLVLPLLGKKHGAAPPTIESRFLLSRARERDTKSEKRFEENFDQFNRLF